MRSAAPRVPRFEEIYRAIVALPEGVTGEILEPGVIRTMGRPGAPHRYASRVIVDALGRFDSMRGGTGWWIEIEAEIRLPGDLLAVPDLAGWRVTETPPGFIRQNPIVQPPDWCCELLSPSTARDDRQVKLPLYARSGVRWIWLVDPDTQRVEVHECRNGSPALVAEATGDQTVALPPFDAEIAVGRWWLPRAAGK
mgnify:FL=1